MPTWCITQDHLLEAVNYLPSPHYNNRPNASDISLIVIHGISLPAGEFGGSAIIHLFCDELDIDTHPSFASLKNLKVSTHILIRRDGELIQFVPFDKRAWHAGESCFTGRDNCNDYSIGIELEGTDDIAYTDVQYEQLNQLIASLQKHYPAITNDRIVGHCDIAPGRKTDPGPSFDWKRIIHFELK